MSEYVCEVWAVCDTATDGTTREYMVTDAVRERIVRCRDCVHWRKPDELRESRCTGAMAFVEPTPDGFCAWGKRREEL